MREPDLLWEAAIFIESGEPYPVMTQPERKRLGKLVAALREAGATPEEVRARAKRYPQVMPPGCKLTLAALVNHWSKLTPAKTSIPQASYVPPPTPSLSERLSGLQYARDHLPPMFRRKS